MENVKEKNKMTLPLFVLRADHFWRKMVEQKPGSAARYEPPQVA
jgi:hypothetical protein